MELTEMQILLTKYLASLKLKEETIITIMLMLQNDDQIVEMAKYLKSCPQATESDIIEKALELSEEE